MEILFVSPYPTDHEKMPLLKKFYFNFCQDFFLKFHCILRELSNINSVILANCVFNLLHIVGLCSKTCLKRPLKDIHNKGH